MATPAVYLTLAIPLGRIADRVGRTTVIIGGYAALLVLYVILSSAASSLATDGDSASSCSARFTR